MAPGAVGEDPLGPPTAVIGATAVSPGGGGDHARTRVLPQPGAAAPPAGSRSAPARLAQGWRAFRTWRRGRPFWAGLFLGLSGVVILVPPYATLRIGDLTLAIRTIGGVSSLVIGVLLITVGLSLWVRPQFRLVAGVAAMLLALVSLVTANLGGFVVGAVLGVVGAALAVSWTDQAGQARPRKRRRSEGRKDRGRAVDDGETAVSATATTTGAGAPTAPTTEEMITREVVDAAERSAAPGESDASSESATSSESAAPGQPTVPGESGARRAPDERPSPGPRLPPSALVVGLLAAAAVAVLIASAPGSVAVAGGRPPATATTTPSPTPAATTAPTTPTSGTPTSGAPQPGPTATSGAPGTSPGAPPSSPSSSPGASQSGSASGTPTPSTPSTSTSPPPTVQAGPGLAATKPFTLTGSRMTLSGLSFDGITDVPIRGGTKRALAFRVTGVDITDMVMTSDVGEGRTMTVRAGPGTVTTIRGSSVVLHTERLVGKLDILGIPIPVDFSPDSPPPLTLPLLFFRDVTVTNAQQLGGTLSIPGAVISLS
ncbi:DUF6114 domain-containing protein [Streptoalloteichus tenebrarius]|uniref:DUF6114 domain-containing protein n=1 Tax=Streptoalloteichus tenebrarius (strain ATCC 17920 / DSM 40477 / JCM 4838 / CBS 697.72 / NBRC 16177 / NCIMB 11028 / NRRL B-12390 / A12253. 1 / ISP 5477) TaxID=1933 RepID=UPI0020A3FF5F|nr:DUF6114 domain-containing protein [Streptoalloteichus tenebrarius]